MSPADSPFTPLPAPGPHPAPAELRAYAAGTLGAADEHRIEAHTLDCERCADLLAGFAMSPAAATDQAVAELRTRLHARLGAADAVPAAPRWGWPHLAAAAAFVGVVAGGIWGWEQHETPEAQVAIQSKTAPEQKTPEIATAAASPNAPAATETPLASEAAVAQAPKAPTPTAATRATEAERAQLRAQALREETKSLALRRAPSAGAPGAPALRSAPAAAGRVASAPIINADAESLADETKEAKDAGTAREAAGSSGSAELSVAMASRAEAPPAQQPEGALADKVASADTSFGSQKPGAMRQFAKIKAAAASTAARDAPVINAPAPTARVRAMSMPAVPAIGPAPQGGTPALREYLRREASNFTPESGAARLSGSVLLKFTVAASGEVRDLKVVRGLRPDYDAEALRMVRDGPAWQPGVARGRRAPLPVELVVSY